MEFTGYSLTISLSCLFPLITFSKLFIIYFGLLRTKRHVPCSMCRRIHRFGKTRPSNANPIPFTFPSIESSNCDSLLMKWWLIDRPNDTLIGIPLNNSWWRIHHCRRRDWPYETHKKSVKKWRTWITHRTKSWKKKKKKPKIKRRKLKQKAYTTNCFLISPSAKASILESFREWQSTVEQSIKWKWK